MDQKHPKKVLILGAGGHAQVVADILLMNYESDKEILPVGYLDDDLSLKDRQFLGIPVLGSLNQINEFFHVSVIVAVGDNRIRAILFNKLNLQGEKLINAVHPDAVISLHVKLGSGVVICAGVVVNTGSVIGDNVILNTACTVDHHNKIHNHVHLAPGVHVGGEVEIGEGTLVGIGASILPQKKIGKWSVIGAGSVVISDIPDKVVEAGDPARIIRKIS